MNSRKYSTFTALDEDNKIIDTNLTYSEAREMAQSEGFTIELEALKTVGDFVRDQIVKKKGL